MVLVVRQNNNHPLHLELDRVPLPNHPGQQLKAKFVLQTTPLLSEWSDLQFYRRHVGLLCVSEVTGEGRALNYLTFLSVFCAMGSSSIIFQNLYEKTKRRKHKMSELTLNPPQTLMMLTMCSHNMKSSRRGMRRLSLTLGALSSALRA